MLLISKLRCIEHEHSYIFFSMPPDLLGALHIFHGGDDRIRTDDLMLAKHALSQLSYIP